MYAKTVTRKKQMESKHTKEELKKLQAYPLDLKIELAESRILEYYHKLNGNVYVSFSGGKDSTVLLHLVRNILPKVEAVFVDTGLEFPELKDFVKTYDNVTIIRPEMSFREVIDKYGYPVISKSVADTINGAKSNSNSLRARKLDGSMKGNSIFDCSKYNYLLDAPFEVNSQCCTIMKKRPFHKFNKISGKSPMTGQTANESLLREKTWLANGCNSFKKGHNISNPLSVWTEKDIWDYIKKFDITLAEPYYMGYERTGCVFCAFGAHLESYPNRFQILQHTHPNLYEYCMRKFDAGGLGMKDPLEYIGVATKDDQMNMFDILDETSGKRGK